MSTSSPRKLELSGRTWAWTEDDDDSDEADFDADDDEGGTQERYHPWSSHPGFGSPSWWSQ